MSEGSEQRFARHAAVAAVVAIVVFGAARLLWLSADPPTDATWSLSLYTDEGLWNRNAVFAVKTGDWQAEHDYNPALLAPVVAIIDGAVMKVFGVGLAPVRALHALLSILAIALLFLWLRRAENTRTALVATLLLATNHLFFTFGRLAMLEIPLAVFLLLAIWIALPREPGRPVLRAAAAGVLLGIAVLTKTTAVCVAPAIAIAFWFRPIPFKWNVVRTIVFLGIALGIWQGWFALMQRLHPEEFSFGASHIATFKQATLADQVKKLYDVVQGGLFMGRIPYLAALLVIAISPFRFRRFLARPAYVVSLLWLGGTIAAYFLRHYPPPRYYVSLVVPVAVIVAIGLDDLLGKRSLIVAALALVVAAVPAAKVVRDVATPEYTYRDFAAALEKRFEADGVTDPVLIGEIADTAALATGTLALTVDRVDGGFEERTTKHPPDYWVTLWPVDEHKEHRQIIERRFEIGPPTSYDVLDNYSKGRPVHVMRLRRR